jgi:hypothetical protein
VLGLRFAVPSDAGPKLEAGILPSPSLGLGDILLVALALTVLTEPPSVDVLAFGQVRVSDHAHIRAVAHKPASMAGREGVEACSRQLGIAGAGLPVWKKMVAQEVVHLAALMRHLRSVLRARLHFQLRDRIIRLSSFVVILKTGGRICVCAGPSIEKIAA